MAHMVTGVPLLGYLAVGRSPMLMVVAVSMAKEVNVSNRDNSLSVQKDVLKHKACHKL